MIIILLLFMHACPLKSATGFEPQLLSQATEQETTYQAKLKKTRTTIMNAIATGALPQDATKWLEEDPTILKLVLFLQKFSPDSIATLTEANQLRIDAENKGDKKEIKQAELNYVRTVVLTKEIKAIPTASVEISAKHLGEVETALIAQQIELEQKLAESQAQLQRLAQERAQEATAAPTYLHASAADAFTFTPFVMDDPLDPLSSLALSPQLPLPAGSASSPASNLASPLQTPIQTPRQSATTFAPSPIFSTAHSTATSLAAAPALSLVKAHNPAHTASRAYDAPQRNVHCTHAGCFATFKNFTILNAHINSCHATQPNSAQKHQASAIPTALPPPTAQTY